MIVEFFIVCILVYAAFNILRRHLDNGLYIPLSKKFAIRRYVFPTDPNLQEYLCEAMKNICLETFDGELAPYRFLHGDKSSLHKRIICLFYDRQDEMNRPIAVHAPFFVDGAGEHIMHAGLMMVIPSYQRQGVQMLAGVNLVLHLALHYKRYAITEIGASSSYLSIQDRYQTDAYPQWRSPSTAPKLWHIHVAKFMLCNYRDEFGCSSLATLDEDNLVVRGYSKGEGGGAEQFLKTHSSRKSKNTEKQAFIDSRIDNNNADGQFFVARPVHPVKALWRTVVWSKC